MKQRALVKNGRPKSKLSQKRMLEIDEACLAEEGRKRRGLKADGEDGSILIGHVGQVRVLYSNGPSPRYEWASENESENKVCV